MSHFTPDTHDVCLRHFQRSNTYTHKHTHTHMHTTHYPSEIPLFMITSPIFMIVRYYFTSPVSYSKPFWRHFELKYKCVYTYVYTFNTEIQFDHINILQLLIFIYTFHFYFFFFIIFYAYKFYILHIYLDSQAYGLENIQVCQV